MPGGDERGDHVVRRLLPFRLGARRRARSDFAIGTRSGSTTSIRGVVRFGGVGALACAEAADAVRERSREDAERDESSAEQQAGNVVHAGSQVRGACHQYARGARGFRDSANREAVKRCSRLLQNSYGITLASLDSYRDTLGVSRPEAVVRTTIYLSGDAARALQRVKTEYLSRYGIATAVSSVLARLLVGETIDEIVERPYRLDLARIASEKDRLHDELRRAQAKRPMNDLRRIHRDVAKLYPRIKEISNTLGRAKTRREPRSPDFAEAGRIEDSLDELMTECSDAIAAGRRR